VGGKGVVGRLINTLPLRLRLQDVTARRLVEQTQRELVELLSYEQASLAVVQRCSGIVGSAPLFSAVLNYRHNLLDPEAKWASASGLRVLTHQHRTNYPIALSVDDLGDGFSLTAHTERRIDPHRILGYMQTAMQSLVEALEQAPQTPALALLILPESERHQVIELFNATHVAYPQRKLIYELFEEQVERSPHAIAVVYEGQSLTYAGLNSRANQLARHLRDKGVGPDQLVGICVERSLEMVVGLLGILKAGGAYVPLDPDYPAERLASMLKDAAPRVLLIEERLRERLPDTAVEVIALDSNWSEIAEKLTSNLDCRTLGLRSNHLAYVIYTSGSTGQPKGVMIEHRNVVSLWQGLEHIYRESTACQRIAVNASFNFDASVKQFVQLLSGRTIVLVPQESRWDASMLLEFIREHRVDGIDCTPSQLRSWISAEFLKSNRCQLHLALVGGEVIDAELWSSLAQCSERRFYNVYGPTECTVDTTFAHLRWDTTVPNIGRPMENRHVYILDRYCQPLPIGVVGEMYIGGAGVARGYLNRPDITAERFIADPFSADPQARLYKSGDLGRWRADGTIEYLGRDDLQVKIRGFRIELGEIEGQLLQHPQVKEAAVLMRKNEFGEEGLVAYVVAEFPQMNPLGQQDSGEAGAEIVAQWKRVHDETYSADLIGPSFSGWNSSYTDPPIPEVQMQEWLACTIDRIRALKPSKVLEIGCGVGLLLQHLAQQCLVYVGTDFSASALAQLRQWASRREDLKHVELLQCSATELENLPTGSFDTVVLNAVAQYFPDIDYLLAVLQQSIRFLGSNGKIFIGDVRHLGLLPMFHSEMQLSKAAATVNVGQLRRRIARAVANEKELVIDPQFFQVLPGRVPGISGVEVHLKRGRAPNELTRYRYDVVLHTGEQMGPRAVCEPLKWQLAIGSTAELEAALRERRWCAVRLSSIPNLRVAREAAAQCLIETSDENLEASALRRQLNELQFDGIDPEKLWELGLRHGYDVTLMPGEEGCFEAQLLDRTRTDQVSPAVSPSVDAMKSWSAYANDPLENGLRQRLIPQLREYLKGRLPEYMIPSAWMVLKQMPLTPNGKLDRRALPAPQGRPEETGEYIAPQTEVERTLAGIWAELLNVDQVGVQDNFFELGGHSLLAMQVVARIGSSLSIEMPIRLVFECPTLKQLSAQVDDLRQVHLLNEVSRGGDDIEELLGRVASMSESKAQDLIRELRMRVKP
jgi:amino acid adenylation domain-containing protein